MTNRKRKAYRYTGDEQWWYDTVRVKRFLLKPGQFITKETFDRLPKSDTAITELG